MSIPEWCSKQLKSGVYESLGHVSWRTTKKHHDVPFTQHLANKYAGESVNIRQWECPDKLMYFSSCPGLIPCCVQKIC